MVGTDRPVCPYCYPRERVQARAAHSLLRYLPNIAQAASLREKPGEQERVGQRRAGNGKKLLLAPVPVGVKETDR